MTIFNKQPITGLLFALLLSGCGENPDSAGSDTALSETASDSASEPVSQPSSEPPLYEHYEDAFLLGTVLNRAQIYGEAPDAVRTVERADRRGYFYEKQLVVDPEGLALGLKHFSALTPENVMKWEEIHPEPGVYDFEAADRFVNIAEQHGKFITGHALVWHNQTPDWVYEDEEGNDLSRDALLQRMREHIHTVVGRYKGRVDSWDVVNEALNEDGTMRESRWYEIVGDDYLVKAFEYAREADPDAELYYNDYSLESPPKREGALRLVTSLQDQGAPITGIGTQSHISMLRFPDLEQVDQTLTDLASLGIDVMVTELDLNVLPSARDEEGELLEGTDIYVDGMPEEVQQEQAQRFRELFDIYLKHSDALARVTFWGFADADSWLNYLPMERTNYPLLFDRNLEPKPAFHAVVEAAQDSP